MVKAVLPQQGRFRRPPRTSALRRFGARASVTAITVIAGVSAIAVHGATPRDVTTRSVAGTTTRGVAGAPTTAGARSAATTKAASAFATPRYFLNVTDDTFYNTTNRAGDILATANDSTGVNDSCTQRGSDIAILRMAGPAPSSLSVSTVNCMTSFGPRAGGNSPDGCSWKSGGITRIGRTIYLSVARQLRQCSYGKETNGLQPSFDASIMKSVDGGRTWTNPWGVTSRDGAAPEWSARLHRYRAMFPGQQFAVPFFIQYGPGNTRTVDGADKYLYAVSTDGYAYNGNYLRLARVPLDQVQQASAWQFYHGRVGGSGASWTSSPVGATHVLEASRGVSQPAIQYVPALKRYVLLTFSFTHGDGTFPNRQETPYTRLRFYTSPKPWGPWTKVFDHTGQRSLWCRSAPCQLIQEPGSSVIHVGAPSDWVGLYDVALVQKFLFTRSLRNQAILACGDWKNATRYPGELLNRLHVIPFDLGTW